MSVIDLYSKRQKRLRGEIPEVFQYENISQEFRMQVIHIINDALGKRPNEFDHEIKEVYAAIRDILCREYGLANLGAGYDHYSEMYNFFFATNNIEKVIDVIELSFKFINGLARKEDYKHLAKLKLNPDDAINELNERFLEHGIGFQFESNQIIRIDSKFAHSEIIKPALLVLQDEIYAGANDEFLKAHEHYRHGKYKECLNECLKSFESTMKSICEKRQWAYKQTDTAKNLLDVCYKEGLIPEYLQNHFTGLRSCLEGGVSPVRNKNSGHGQGTQITTVPQYLASYLLNLTATSILLLVEAEKTK